MNLDYKRLGLMVGLEIHQQLNSGHKLFCKCPVTKEEEFPIEIQRRLRAVPGELGDFDPAALHEYLRGKKFVYKLNPKSSCLVELDDDPPKDMNKEAVISTLKICKLMSCKVVDEICVMRKTVIDGSSVSGFQRTSLVATNGFLDTSFGKVGIQTVCLEEDSAPAVQKTKDIVEYRLDRLGIPLIEIATSPDMHTPSEAKETAEKIGFMLRSINVVRGIGSIRQDVNVSVEGGARVEIKGFQEIERMEEMIDNEIKRQVALLEIKNELHKRGLHEIRAKPVDVTKIFKNTHCTFVKKVLDEDGKVFAIVLPLFSGLMKKECGERTFGKELTDYVAPFGFNGIIHSDEDLEKYKLSEEFQKLAEELNTAQRDVVTIIAGKENIEKAINALLERTKHCLIGVPEETRVADGINSKFTRPLPGSGRLYPETDVKPIRITKTFIDSIKTPKTLFEKQKDLEKVLPKEMAAQIVRSIYYQDFEELLNKHKVEPVIIANIYTSFIKDLVRRGFDTRLLNKEKISAVLSAIEKKKISKDSVPQIMEDITSKIDVEQAIDKYTKITDEEIREIVKEAVTKSSGEKESVIMGMLMSKLRGKVDGNRLMKILREEISK